MPAQLTLYRADGSCAIAAHVLLRHLNIPFTSVIMGPGPAGVEAADGSITAAEYRKIHPSGLVPALKIHEDDSTETVVTELSAILHYIASLSPLHQLLGRDGLETARIVEWTSFLSSKMHATGYGAVLRPTRFARPELPNSTAEIQEVIRASGKTWVLECYEGIEAKLHGVHAVGERLTIVDMNLLPFFFWGRKHLGLDMRKYKRYTALIQALSKVDGVLDIINKEDQREYLDYINN